MLLEWDGIDPEKLDGYGQIPLRQTVGNSQRE